ncbi:MAG: DUF4870 domain-containing protein [Candidatus Micrarchaeota archaeon]|nr:DUF4870 domain-containing protein [Candidatus Micrarchaeota archaeon]
MPKKAPKETKPEKASEKDSYLLGAIAYLLGILAILLYLMKKEDRFVRFHSVQSIILSVVCFVVFVTLSILFTIISVVTGGVGSVLSLCLFPLVLGVFVLVLYAAWKAFQGEMWHMPVIGEFAEKYAQ